MKKLILFLSLSIFVFNKSEAQTTLFSYDSVLQYLAATSEPDLEWSQPDFDDSGWTSDTARLQFGETAAEIITNSRRRPPVHPVNPNAKSIYIRFDFNITNKSEVKALNLAIDYDDGYIAYLNGHEIARVNVDKSVEFPSFDALATRSHESELIRDYPYPIEGVYLDSALLDTCLVEGNNVMAVHILNDSVNGSDMVFIPRLWNITNAFYNIYNPPARFKQLLDLDSTNLPLVIINSDEFGITAERDALRVKAFMGIIDNGPGVYNHSDDEFNVYSGDIDIEVRGQSSSEFPKQSFRFELRDPDGGDTSAILLGMPKDDDWILSGPFADRSQVRNKLVMDLGSQLGHYQPRSMFCELILNGQIVGLYALMENIKRGKDRVNISKMKNSDIDGLNVTGGYIYKWDKNDFNQPELFIVYPKADSIQPEQTAYFNSFMESYDSIFTSDKFIDPGYKKYLDDSTLVDYIIMSELCKNADSYRTSTYFYKDRADKDNRVKFGPLWDYDLGFGNTHWQNAFSANGWIWNETTNQMLGIRRLLQDTALVDFLQDRWYALRESILSDEYIFATIDSMVSCIDEARERNYQIWPIIDKNPWNNNWTYMVANYDEEINYLKNWIAARTGWMDENMDDIYYPLKVYSSIETYATVNYIDCYAYPNPFADQLTLEINSDEASNIRIEISNILGQQFYSSELGIITSQKVSLSGQQFGEMPTGVYLLRVFTDNILNKTIKVIKK